DIAARLEKFITGSFRGLFDQKSNIDLNNPLIVFSVKEIEEEMRPIAMYVILDFIWTRVKRNFKKRLLMVDEAWYFMKNQDSASFLYSMAKRARKYYLGVTTISQDVEDFLANDYGKAIVSNSSIQFLMKQSSVSIPALVETFHLSQGERQLLLSVDVGEGIFFAGQNHVALRVIASPEEHRVITTNPEEVMRRQQQQAALEAEVVSSQEEDTENEETSASTTTPTANNASLEEIYSLINNLTQKENPSATTQSNKTSVADNQNPSSEASTNEQPNTNDNDNSPVSNNPTAVSNSDSQGLEQQQFAGQEQYSIDNYRPPENIPSN
ncbi:hypothetical protein IJI99_03575, partial [bacterium]|nr:hypothetical protein [bacterium]